MSTRGYILNKRYCFDKKIGHGAQAIVLLVTDTNENNEKY